MPLPGQIGVSDMMTTVVDIERVRFVLGGKVVSSRRVRMVDAVVVCRVELLGCHSGVPADLLNGVGVLGSLTIELKSVVTQRR
jgi:hypothetical protein